jgi:hypothetical protein
LKKFLPKTERGILPFKTETVSLDPVPKEMEFFPHFLQSDLGFPLERGVGLGNEGGHADTQVGTDPLFRSQVRKLPGQGDDPPEIFVLFGGKADHEIELEIPPSHPVEISDPLEQDLFIDLKEVVKAGCTPSKAQIAAERAKQRRQPKSN